MYWWPIIENLCKFLQSQPELAGIHIIAGGTDEHIYPCIEILWDEERGIDPHKHNKGNITLWIDGWVENNDPAESTAYSLLYQLQKGFFDVIDKWPEYLVDQLGLAIKLTVGRTVSDGGTSRPIAGSRTILEIEWRGGKNYGYSES